MSETIDAFDAIHLLNEAVAADPEAVTQLVETRVPTNESMAEHPTIQVGATDSPKHYMVGLLGLINGLFGVNSRGSGYIAAVKSVYCDNGCEDPDFEWPTCGECGEDSMQIGQIEEFVLLEEDEET